MEAVDELTIERLNREARKLAGKNYDPEKARWALEQVARRHGMAKVEEREEEYWRVAYKLPDDRLVSCRLRSPWSGAIEEGGLGFEDELTWMESGES